MGLRFNLYLVLLGCALVFATNAECREVDYYVGFNVNVPYFFEPESVVGDTSINLYGEMFVTDYLSITQQFEFGVNGFFQRSYVGGLKGYFFSYHQLSPYLAGQGVFQYHPNLDGGIRGSLGLQWDLTDVLGLTYLATYYETNFGILFNKPASAIVDIVRIGILWGF